MEHWQRKLEKDYAWQRKGKKFKTKYFEALKSLYGGTSHDKDCQHEESTANGGPGAKSI